MLRMWSACCSVTMPMGAMLTPRASPRAPNGWGEPARARSPVRTMVGAALATVFVAVGAIGYSACGEDAGNGGFGLELSFQVASEGTLADFSCAAFTQVDRFEVTVVGQDSLAVLPGYPVSSGCQPDPVFISGIQPGRYSVEVVAWGPLGEVTDAVLFSGQRDFTFPRSEPLAVVLEPEVSFLELDWTFGDDGLALCGTQIDSVEVAIEGVDGFGAYVARFGCTQTPVRVPRPFVAQEYFIRIEAFSPQDELRLFVHADRRFLVRGENRYLAVLEPLGGRIIVDWRFAIGTDALTDCAAGVVDVDEVAIQVFSRDVVGLVDTATVSCTMAPFGLDGNRYAQGRLLRIVARAEGKHRFVGAHDVVMPAGDLDTGQLTLDAVGSAVLTATVRTATCSEAGVTGYAVSVTGPFDFSENTLVLSPSEPSVELSGLPYGPYDIELEQQAAGGIQCRARGRRFIGQRNNDWAPFEF